MSARAATWAIIRAYCKKEREFSGNLTMLGEVDNSQ